MNPYLEKIASQNREASPVRESVLAAAGAGVASTAPSRILGYHTLYHGTSSENAEAIKKKGFDPSKGGSRNAQLRPDYVENSKNKVHFTKTKFTAGMYAGDFGGKMSHARAAGGSKKSALKESIKDWAKGKGKVVTSRVPHSMWGKMEIDRDSSVGSPDHPMVNEAMKERASTYHKRLDPKFVEGSEAYGGRRMYATHKNLKRYLSTASGRSRALSGVVRLGAGVGMMAGAAYHNAHNNGVLAKLRSSKSQDTQA